jgi:hypothetical protein
VLASSVAFSQVKTKVPDVVPGAPVATVERITIHGKALEGNLEGDVVDRPVLVFLPPSYARERNRRYPVVYALHGYSIGAEQWSQEIHVPQTMEGAFALGTHEMIVVLPDSKTVHNGSMYSSSGTTGDYENFIAGDVVSFDVGDQDSLKIDTGKLHDVLTNYRIKHDFEIYSGTHTSHVAVRFQENVMPFFSRTLSFETTKR